MGDYSNGQNVLIRRPEPGRPVQNNIVEVKTKEASIDTDAIANDIVAKISQKLSVGNVGNVMQVQRAEDTFDASSSMDKLAKAMGKTMESSHSNLDGVGTIKETKKDKEDTNKTIDLLSKLGD